MAQEWAGAGGRVRGQGQGAEAGVTAGTGAGTGGRDRGQARGPGQEDADLQDLELKGGREGTLQHGPGAILEGAIGSCRDPTSFG